jgi:hypothetical protein
MQVDSILKEATQSFQSYRIQYSGYTAAQADVSYFTHMHTDIIEVPWKEKNPYTAQVQLNFGPATKEWIAALYE